MTQASERVSEPEKKDKQYEIVINGTLVDVEEETVTYEQLGELAYPDHDPQAMFSIAYRNANSSHSGRGTLVAGESVRVKAKGTSFDVRLTTRS